MRAHDRDDIQESEVSNFSFWLILFWILLMIYLGYRML